MNINKKSFGILLLGLGIIITIIGVIGVNTSFAGFDIIYAIAFVIPGSVIIVVGVILLALGKKNEFLWSDRFLQKAEHLNRYKVHRIENKRKFGVKTPELYFSSHLFRLAQAFKLFLKIRLNSSK